MTGRTVALLIMLAQAGCSTLALAPTPITSFCDRTDLSAAAANYSVNYIKKPDPQFNASYWNMCGPAWTRGLASLTYSPSAFDASYPASQLEGF